MNGKDAPQPEILLQLNEPVFSTERRHSVRRAGAAQSIIRTAEKALCLDPGNPAAGASQEKETLLPRNLAN
jgi:hypothetical protein